MSGMRKAVLGAAFTAAVFSTTPASALEIILNPTGSGFTTSPNGAAALAGFRAAANFWNTFLTNDATINLNIGFNSLSAGVIAQAGSRRVDVAATTVYSALGANAVTALDAIAVANLVELTDAGGVNYRMPSPNDPVTGLGLNTTLGSVFDNNDSYNNTVLYANTSNLKALGLTVVNPNTADATITFSSNFAFDFDPTDGISYGTQDFVAVAVHEIGHALGFVSGTDFYDQYGGPNGPSVAVGNTVDWQDESVLSVWDLFRYSTNPPSNAGFDPDTEKRYLQLTPNRGAAFSIDGVNFFNAGNPDAEFANLSTGRYNGDGEQASHWKDERGYFDQNGCFVSNRQIGILDPTSGTCQPGIVTSNDLGAFDAMGYNLDFDILQNLDFTYTSAQIYRDYQIANPIPEPATWAMMIAGFGFIGSSMRRSAKRPALAA